MRPKLLLADDEPSIRESLRKLFQAEQYDVVMAVNGEEAVHKVRADPTQIDLVLIDLNQPLGIGAGSVDQLREVNPLLPILLLTRRPHQRAMAETAHVSALVEKPIDVPALLSLIRQLWTNIERSHLAGFRPWQQPFQYLPSNPKFSAPPHLDPYSHWGPNR